LEAQREAVRQFLNGGNWTLAAEFVEVESGKNDKNRPELARAIRAAKLHGAKLVIAKLDRVVPPRPPESRTQLRCY
jgi:DNA invertase Pin-like site-specific DNA recombinase